MTEQTPVPGKVKKGLSLVWSIGIAVVVIFVLAAIATPKFIRFDARSRQSEAKANLKALFTAEQAFVKEKGAFTASFEEIGFAPEKPHRYTYLLEGAIPDICAVTPGKDGEGRELRIGVTPGPKGGFVGLAVVVPADRSPSDCWSIASMDRVNARGERIAAGEPANENARK